MTSSDLQVISAFIDTVQELRSSSFATRLSGRISVGLWGDTNRGVMLSQLEGAERDSLKAFLLSLRCLRHEDEQTSLRSVAQIVGECDPGVKAEFLAARDMFNDFLDQRLPHRVGGIGTDTRRDLFATFLGGQHTHSEPENRARLKRWEPLPHYPHLEVMFLQAVVQFMSAVGKMAEVCERMREPVVA